MHKIPPSMASSTHVGYITSITPNSLSLAPKDLILVVEADDLQYHVFKLPIKLPVIKAAQMPCWISAWIILNKYYHLKGSDKAVIDCVDETIFSKAVIDIGKYMGITILNMSNKSDRQVIETVKDGSIKLGITNSSSVSRAMTKLLGPKGVVVICDNDIFERPSTEYERIYFPIAKAIFTNISIEGFNFNKMASLKADWVNDGINAVQDMMNYNFFQYIESYEEKDLHQGLAYIERTGKSVVLFTNRVDVPGMK